MPEVPGVSHDGVHGPRVDRWLPLLGSALQQVRRLQVRLTRRALRMWQRPEQGMAGARECKPWWEAAGVLRWDLHTSRSELACLGLGPDLLNRGHRDAANPTQAVVTTAAPDRDGTGH